MADKEMAKQDTTPSRRPVDMFDALRSEMNRMFERFESGQPGFAEPFAGMSGKGLVVPHMDVSDLGDKVVVETELPGVSDEDVSVSFADGLLRIKGSKKQEREETKDNFYVSERNFGSFERAFRLPDAIDEESIEAKLDKGVLTVTAKKKPDAIKAARKIEIK